MNFKLKGGSDSDRWSDSDIIESSESDPSDSEVARRYYTIGEL